MSQAEIILKSLEVATEKVEDLAPLVYPRFFKKYPDSEAEFGDDPGDYTKGRMLMNLLLEIVGYAEDKVFPGNVRRWISDHLEYGLIPEMYTYMLSCMRDVVKELNGSEWNDETEAAWQAQFDKLMIFVNEAYTE